jgi:hypothetical protein
MLVVAVLLTGCTSTSPDLPPDDDPSLPTVEKLGFSGGNIGAGGLMGGDGQGWVYYRSEMAGWHLYKARLDGTEKTKISDDYPSLINVLGGWVYYVNYQDQFSLYRVRTDGTDRQKLVDGYCGNLFVAESGMYFDLRDASNSPQVYKANLDGSGMELLVPDMSIAYYRDGVVYSHNTARLCSYDLETGTLRNLIEGYVHSVCVNQDCIYYWLADADTYCRADLDGGNVEVLARGGDYYSFSGHTLYFQGYGGSNNDYVCLYGLDTGTGEVTPWLSLSDQYFGDQGELLGVTLVQLREGTVELPESLFGPDGSFMGYSESADYTYVIEDRAFTRGNLRSNLLQTGRVSCWILLDGASGTAWD